MCLGKISSREETSSKQLLDQQETFSEEPRQKEQQMKLQLPLNKDSLESLRRWQSSAGAETRPWGGSSWTVVMFSVCLFLCQSALLILPLLLTASSSSPAPHSPPSSSARSLRFSPRLSNLRLFIWCLVIWIRSKRWMPGCGSADKFECSFWCSSSRSLQGGLSPVH